MKRLITLLILSVAVSPIFAQDNGRAVLEFFEDEFEVEISDAQGMPREVFLGQELFPGDTVRTADSTAELRLDPNGTIIKLGPDTAFGIGAIEGRGSSRENRFDLSEGRLRAVVARATGNSYEFRTPFAVGGVRGTDFVLDVVPGETNALFVQEGSVAFDNIATGESILVGAGQGADTFADAFAAFSVPPGQLRGLFDSLEFQAVDPLSVGPESEAEGASSSSGATATTSIDQDVGGAGGSSGNPIMDRILESLRLEAGSVLLDGQTYGKVVLQPEIRRDKFAVGFYVPIVYTDNLLNASTWYRPGGNNEWSFGSDHDWGENPSQAAADLFTDIGLKLRYIRYGRPGDPFFAKVGAFQDLSLGHGILVYNYANDWDFPAVRRIGVNMGIDRDGSGMEFLVNDILDPELYGTRLYYRPFTLPLAFGVSATVDFTAADVLPLTAPVGFQSLFDETRRVDPILLNFALDIEVPVIDRDLLNLVAFSDIAAPIPYLREEVLLGDGTEAGLQSQIVVNPGTGALQNFGTMTGVLGRVGPVDFRADYRTFRGIFRPFNITGPYDRLRGGVAADTIEYFISQDSPKFNDYGMGVYGEAGFGILRDGLTFRAGYLWPWKIEDGGDWAPADDDQLLVELRLSPELLPIPVSASIQYERRGFVPTLVDRGEFQGATLFDANTTLLGEVAYEVSPGLTIAVTASTSVVYTEDGEVAYSDGKPETATTMTVETRIGY